MQLYIDTYMHINKSSSTYFETHAICISSMAKLLKPENN